MDKYEYLTIAELHQLYQREFEKYVKDVKTSKIAETFDSHIIKMKEIQSAIKRKLNPKK